MPSPSTASQSRINAERLAHLLPKGNPPDSIRPEHALSLEASAPPDGVASNLRPALRWSRTAIVSLRRISARNNILPVSGQPNVGREHEPKCEITHEWNIDKHRD